MMLDESPKLSLFRNGVFAMFSSQGSEASAAVSKLTAVEPPASAATPSCGSARLWQPSEAFQQSEASCEQSEAFPI